MKSIMSGVITVPLSVRDLNPMDRCGIKRDESKKFREFPYTSIREMRYFDKLHVTDPSSDDRTPLECVVKEVRDSENEILCIVNYGDGLMKNIKFSFNQLIVYYNRAMLGVPPVKLGQLIKFKNIERSHKQGFVKSITRRGVVVYTGKDEFIKNEDIYREFNIDYGEVGDLMYGDRIKFIYYDDKTVEGVVMAIEPEKVLLRVQSEKKFIWFKTKCMYLKSILNIKARI